MAKLIEITKILEQNSIYYYLASTSDFEAKSFYMGIDPLKKRILLFLTNDFSSPIKIIDLTKTNEQISIPEINPKLLWPAIGKAMKAIKRKEFPPSMDYAA